MNHNKKLFLSLLILSSFCCTSCSQAQHSSEAIQPPHEITEVDDEEVAASFQLVQNGIRDNAPFCLETTHTGLQTFSNSLCTIDISNASEGYIMVKYSGTNPKVKFQLTGSDGVTYTYNLGSDFAAFPLSAGSGQYKAAVYENVSGTQYSTALSREFNVSITNVFGPNLYPNQYVDFNATSEVVSKAAALVENCSSDIEAVTKIYNFVTTNITYDHNKAATVQSGYTSNVDYILNCGTGICLDYAAVMTSMLRSQKIPTRLEVGYAGSAYHAWISTYITDVGWVNGIIQFDGTSWSIMDPTFAANSSESALKSFIGNGSNYQTKYVY